MVVRNGMMDRSEALKLSKSKLRIFKGREPLKGLNVGDAKNLSHDNLERITNNFSDPIGRVGRASLFRGFMDDGQEVTVKTWDFMFPAVYRCVGYPRDFHDEIVLLKRSGLKSCPFFLKLVGFCFEKKLAIVYDLKFKKSLWLSFDDMEIEKGYIFEFGILLLELIMKRVRAWDASYHLSSYIKEKGGSAVHETLEVDAVTSTEISKLIETCVCMDSAQRPDIDSVISELKRIVGSG
ncbi:hypothetical protein BC332_06916 [Capsicum chinense]|nr:hypothetical protein BC332_06916 [Capsicum chinense]